MTDQTTLDTQQQLRSDFTNGLRELADWVDAHPELDLPYCVESSIPARFSIGIFASDHAYEEGEDDTVERFAAAVKALGGERQKEATDTTMKVSRMFGPGLLVEVWASRERVCEAVVVGTKTVLTERVVTPAVTETVIEEQDVIEWRCAPILERQTA